jgi:hypothetical protein
MTAKPHHLADTLHEMPVEHLACRDFGHSWQPFSAAWLAKERAYRTQLRCARCGTIRERWLDRYGAQVSSQYHYADGYLIHGLGRLTGHDRDAVRLASVQALIPAKRKAGAA